MITINNLSHRIDDNIIIDKFTYSFENKVTVIVGKSGCGKSQLLKQIISGNNSIKSDSTNFGYMPQDLLLFKWYTVFKNLQLSNNFNSDIEQLLKDFGLYHLKDKYINNLSGGEQSRVAFLRAFLLSEKYIILDEPFSKLDYLTHLEVLNWLQNIIKKYDKYVILVTHNLDEAILLADEIVVLQNKATISNVLRKPFNKQKIIESL